MGPEGFCFPSNPDLVVIFGRKEFEFETVSFLDLLGSKNLANWAWPWALPWALNILPCLSKTSIFLGANHVGQFYCMFPDVCVLTSIRAFLRWSHVDPFQTEFHDSHKLFFVLSPVLNHLCMPGPDLSAP